MVQVAPVARFNPWPQNLHMQWEKPLKKNIQMSVLGVPAVVQWVNGTACLYGIVHSIPGPARWVKDPAEDASWGSSIAAAVVWVADAAWIQSLAQEVPYASNAAKKNSIPSRFCPCGFASQECVHFVRVAWFVGMQLIECSVKSGVASLFISGFSTLSILSSFLVHLVKVCPCCWSLWGINI